MLKAMNSTSRYWWFALAVVLLIGLGGRLWLANRNTFPSVDGVFYLEQSRQLIREGTLPFSSFPPGWPMLAAIVLAFLDCENSLNVLRAGQVANVFFGTALPLLTFLLIRRRAGPAGALMGAVFITVLPLNLLLSKGDLSEMSYACFILTAALLARKKTDFSVGLLLLIVPYLLFIRVTSGIWSLSSKALFLSRSVTGNSPVEFVNMVADNMVTFLAMLPDLIGLPLVLLAVWGAWCGRGRWLVFLTPLLPLPLFDFAMAPRYWAPYLPFLLLAALIGIRQIAQVAAKIRPNAGRPLAVGILGLAAVLGFMQAAQDETSDLLRNQESYFGLKASGKWLSSRVTIETAVAGYKPYASFWAGCRFIQYSQTEPDYLKIIEDARQRGARFLVVNYYVTRHFMPGLGFLLTNPEHPSLQGKITLVKFSQYSQEAQTTAIFEINDALP